MPLPASISAVFYAYTISYNGHDIGTLQSFSPTSTRTCERIRSILFSRGATVQDMVWGGTDTSLECEMVRLYQQNMFQVWGVNVQALEEITQPMDINEILHYPDTHYDIVTYHQCGWERWGETRNVGTAHIAGTASFAVSYVTGQHY